MTLTDAVAARLDACALASDERAGTVGLRLDEDGFRLFYDRTARSLWAYLTHVTGNPNLADDLLQESYYRLLRADVAWENEAHCRHYLFRIATNLARDGWRRRGHEVPLPASGEAGEPQVPGDVAAAVASREDLRRAMRQMKPRERELLWLAYAEGSSHREIAAALALSPGSIRQLLMRARRKLAQLLQVGLP